tara:strand:- start:224 stop:724 length:501 start_codon:yes stop_codon:yes gene_type:complete
MNNIKRWIAVYTKPRHEKTVQRKLDDNGFEVYLPMLRKRQQWSDRKRWVDFPLFRSYVFVCTHKENHMEILQTPSIISIVKFGKKIAYIEDKTINSIKQIIEGGFIPETTNYFINGDPVKIKHGPLKGITGEVVRIDKNNCLIIRIDTIKLSISIKIEKKFLEPHN